MNEMAREASVKGVDSQKSSKRSALNASQSNHFSAEDVQQIIALATRQTEFSSRAQIEEIAQELSIDSAAIANAIEIWQSQKLKAQKQQRRRQQFYKYELVPYLVVNAFLVWLNLSLSGTLSWVIYPIMGWGSAILISFLSGSPGSSSGGSSIGCFHKHSALEQSVEVR